MLDNPGRFWSKVNKAGDDECWEWTSVRHPFGHGKFRVGGKFEYAHRVAYALEVEKPGDELVLHKCDNPPCVNPSHLYLGGHSDNTKDAYDRGRLERRSPLDEREVRKIKEMLAAGEKTQREIARAFDVSPGCIGNISTGRRWDHFKINGGETA